MSTSVVMPAAAARVSGPEALPLRAAGVVDVHVGVDQARQEDVAEVLQAGAGRTSASYASTAVICTAATATVAARPFGSDDARRARRRLDPSDVGHPDPSLCRCRLPLPLTPRITEFNVLLKESWLDPTRRQGLTPPALAPNPPFWIFPQNESIPRTGAFDYAPPRSQPGPG